MGFFLRFCLIGFDSGNSQLAIHRVFAKNFIALFKESLLDTQGDLFGEEGLTGVGCRTDSVAAPAFGTGVAVEQLLPGKLLRPGNTVVFALLKVLYQRQSTFGSVAAEEDVEGRSH